MELKEELGNLENVKDLLDSELIIDYVVPPLLLQLAANPRVARDNYFYGGFINFFFTI